MLRRLLRVCSSERLLIIYLSTLLRSSRTTACRECCCTRPICDPRTMVKGPCGKCIQIKQDDTRCQQHKWQKLCEMSGSIKCATTPNCVLPTWIMDGKDDCGDGSDEEPCKLLPCSTPETTTSSSTAQTTQTTHSTTTTVPSTTLSQTPPELTRPSEIPLSCDTGQYRCVSGECIDGQLVMDGRQDCFDNSDEEYCTQHASDCPIELPCSYNPDIGTFGCGCPQNVVRSSKGVCEVVQS